MKLLDRPAATAGLGLGCALALLLILTLPGLSSPTTFGSIVPATNGGSSSSGSNQTLVNSVGTAPGTSAFSSSESSALTSATNPSTTETTLSISDTTLPSSGQGSSNEAAVPVFALEPANSVNTNTSFIASLFALAAVSIIIALASMFFVNRRVREVSSEE